MKWSTECTCSASVLFSNNHTNPTRGRLTSPCVSDCNTLFICRRDQDEEVHGSCEVKPPQSWCTIYEQELDGIAYVDTNCTATVSHQGDGVPVSAPESSSWLLGDVGKLNCVSGHFGVRHFCSTDRTITQKWKKVTGHSNRVLQEWVPEHGNEFAVLHFGLPRRHDDCFFVISVAWNKACG